MQFRKGLLVGGIAVGLVAAACGGGNEGGTTGGASPTGGTTTAGGAPATMVTAVDFAFQPTMLSVNSGDTVTLTNNGQASHTFTLVEDPNVEVVVAPGESGDVTIDVDPGTYQFHCRFHSQMTGTIQVA
jgi:plastocyanin